MRIQSVVGIFRLARMRSEPPTGWFGWFKRSASAQKAEPPVVAASVRNPSPSQSGVKPEPGPPNGVQVKADRRTGSRPVRALGGIRTPNLLIRRPLTFGGSLKRCWVLRGGVGYEIHHGVVQWGRNRPS